MKHRFTTNEGIELIKNFEGFSSEVYKDVVGLYTIGYGHLITKDDDRDTFGKGINMFEGEELLKKDLFKSERAVLRLVNVPLSDGQFNALVSFCFNLGSGSLQRSTLRQKVNRGEYEDVGNEFLKWIYAGGKIFKGLVRRRKAEREMFLEG